MLWEKRGKTGDFVWKSLGAIARRCREYRSVDLALSCRSAKRGALALGKARKKKKCYWKEQGTLWERARKSVSRAQSLFDETLRLSESATSAQRIEEGGLDRRYDACARIEPKWAGCETQSAASGDMECLTIVSARGFILCQCARVYQSARRGSLFWDKRTKKDGQVKAVSSKADYCLVWLVKR